MKHYSEDTLILHYYGEGTRRGDVEKHLTECAGCGSMYRDISETLAVLTEPEVPERSDQYGLEVWQRIRHQLPEQERSWFSTKGWGLGPGVLGWGRGMVMAGAAAMLLIGAFLAGRGWPAAPGLIAPGVATTAPSTVASDEGAPDRILLTSVADHLERSERMLTDIMNSPVESDISTQQEWAEDLLQTSRLYRQDATDAGEQSVAMVLDELERNLLEIVHSPSQVTAMEFEQLRRRIDAAALLFKVRVMSDELRKRETPPASAAPQTSTPKIS